MKKINKFVLLIAVAMFLLSSSVIQADNGGGCSDWERVVAPDCQQ